MSSQAAPPKADPPAIPLWPWGLVALVSIPLMLAALLVWFRTDGARIFGDVDWYATGLRALLADGPLYEPAKLAPHVLRAPAYWDQAPSAAPVTLLLLLPGGGWLWGGLMAACLVGGMALIWPKVGPGGVLLLAPVLLVWLPVIDAVGWANLNAAVFLLLAAALRYPKAAGVAIGIAAALKVVPILAVAWLIGRRDWRQALIAVAIPIVATVAVVAIKGPDTVSDFVLLRLNQTTVAGPTRWGVFQALGLPDMAGYVVAALLTLAAAWRKSYSLTIIAMLAAIPVLYSHYWLWLLIPAMAIWIPWVIGLTTRTPPPSPLGVPSPQSEGAVPSL